MLSGVGFRILTKRFNGVKLSQNKMYDHYEYIPDESSPDFLLKRCMDLLSKYPSIKEVFNLSLDSLMSKDPHTLKLIEKYAETDKKLKDQAIKEAKEQEERERRMREANKKILRTGKRRKG